MMIMITSIQTETPLRLWTVEEYHRMAEMGILQPDEPVELIAGQIIRHKIPQRTPHAAAITRTERVIRKALGEQVLIRIQLPIELNNYSEPEPDIAVVKVDPRDYIDHHPRVLDVYLVIEVADRTLNKDRNLKAKEYGISGIDDYWILDVNNRQLRVFREPTQNGYRSEVILAETESISPLRFPELSIEVQQLLPPVI